MRFWDSSALLPLFVAERSTAEMRELAELDSDIIVWTLTFVELISSVWRREPGAYPDIHRAEAARRISAADGKWFKVSGIRAVIAVSKDVANRRRLRAGDTLQLSAAIVASDGHPASLPFVTLDRDLASAARAEGFPVLP